MIVLCFFTLLRVLLSFSVVAGSQIYISKRQRLHTGTQIQIAFLAFCFHHHRFKAKCSLSLSIASRIKPFVLAFFCVILWFLDGSGFFLYQHRWCLACVYCSLSLSPHIRIRIRAFSLFLLVSGMRLCVCVAKAKETLATIHWFDHGCFKRNCSKKREWKKEWKKKKLEIPPIHSNELIRNRRQLTLNHWSNHFLLSILVRFDSFTWCSV